MATFDEPLYGWVIEGKSVAEYTLARLGSRFVAQVNALPFTRSDGELYHFTTGAAAMSILKSDELWLTDYNSLADGSELRHGLELTDATIAGFDDELSPETVSLFRTALKSPLPRQTYVSCFSLLRDSPKHWDEYAGTSTGVAIGFEPLGFYDLTTVDPRAVTLSRVAYLYGLKSSILLGLAVLTDDAIQFDQTRNLYDADAYSCEIRHLLLDVIPLFKEAKFSREHEARLLVVPDLSLSGVARELQPREHLSANGARKYVTTRDLTNTFSLPFTRVVLGRSVERDTYNAVVEIAETLKIPVERP